MRWSLLAITAALLLVSWSLVAAANAARVVYYDPTIRDIVARDCSRCHSGPVRNLMSYPALKSYADRGVLGAMVQSLMRQFAGPDAGPILDWIAAGAPEKAPGAAGSGKSATPAAAQKIYFEPTVRDIIVRDCGRCHSGKSRNLTDWDHIRVYVDNGMLEAMLQGPMQRFAGPDADVILAWIKSGASENPPKSGGGATPAALVCPTPPGGGFQMRQQPMAGNITYTNTIADVLNRDCLRCHLGPFRKLTTYEDVKFYVDNGLLETLVMTGGPMHRFAGPDTKFFMMWIRAGAPR